MNTAIWIVQIVLALAFLMAGIGKATQPLDKLSERMKWIPGVQPPSLVRVIGVLEALGAIGLILPALTGILPWLTPLAAAGLALIMLLALAFHLRRGDPSMHYVTNIVLLALAVFVVYGRLVAVPLV
jgi:uncharacterized membrane protein YphA (DoxX/SURF4 family)